MSQDILREIDEILNRFNVHMWAARKNDDDDKMGEATNKAMTEAKQRLSKLLNEARISELTTLLSEVPMPSLSYEQVENRIKQLKSDRTENKV